MSSPVFSGKERRVEAVGVIPARYGSSRFPGKPLADLLGKPLVQHVWEGTRQSLLLSRVIVATDDDLEGDVVTLDL